MARIRSSIVAKVPKVAGRAVSFTAVRPCNTVSKSLSLDLAHHVTGKRGGARPSWVERRFKARLRGRIINIKKFRFVIQWLRSGRYTPSERKNKKASKELAITLGSSDPSPIRSSKRMTKNSMKSAYSWSDWKNEVAPSKLMPLLTHVVPDCVFDKILSKKRLTADARMALETFQEEARRQPIVRVELSEEEREEDLRQMRGKARLPTNPEKVAHKRTLAA